MEKFAFSRRHLLASAAALGIAALSGRAFAAAMLDAAELGAIPGPDDQTGALQKAFDTAAAQARPLFLPPGTYRVTGLIVPDGLQLTGMPGQTILALSGGDTLLSISGRSNVTIQGIAFDGSGGGTGNAQSGLIDVQNSRAVTLTNLSLRNATGNALALFASEGLVENCDIAEVSTAIFALDNTGLVITSNRVARCRNNGILVWRSASGADGTIVTGNRIADVAFEAGGNGQNGNGINVFRAGEVIVANNHITGCAFSAVRLNATTNTQVTGNTCIDSGETAIFSEFGFSGSVIANNVIDKAALGISIANLDSEGHLATCSGNIVRNILPSSPNNPDTTPCGIFAEADVAITGNVVDSVPGPGILAGWGPFLRNVLVNGNVVRNTQIGIAASVAEGAGSAQITGNTISGAETPLAGMAWTEMRSGDLATDAGRFANVRVAGNVVS